MEDIFEIYKDNERVFRGNEEDFVEQFNVKIRELNTYRPPRYKNVKVRKPKKLILTK